MGLTNAQKRKRKNKNNRKLYKKLNNNQLSRKQAQDMIELEAFRKRYNSVDDSLDKLRKVLYDVVLRSKQVRGIMLKLKDKLNTEPDTLNLTMSIEEHMAEVDSELTRLDKFEREDLRPLVAKWDSLIKTTDNVDKMMQEAEVTLSLQQTIVNLNATMADHSVMLDRLSNLDKLLGEMEEEAKAREEAEKATVDMETPLEEIVVADLPKDAESNSSKDWPDVDYEINSAPDGGTVVDCTVPGEVTISSVDKDGQESNSVTYPTSAQSSEPNLSEEVSDITTDVEVEHDTPVSEITPPIDTTSANEDPQVYAETR